MMRFFAGMAVCLLAGCTPAPDERVDPARYDAFFLWAGVRAPEVLESAKTIYLLDGEVQVADATRLVPLRPHTPQVRHADVWLTVRLERLDWHEGVYRQIMADLERWERAGNRVVGLQLDFDAKTRGLNGYAAFLRDMRTRLPARYKLSITGLMDWSAGGDSAALASLADVVDEVIVQTYQGRDTIPGYQRYLATLQRLPMNYRIGLVERGQWQAPPTLARDPQFKGYVVFLLPR